MDGFNYSNDYSMQRTIKFLEHTQIDFEKWDAMVVYGFDTTLPVTLDMMINHGAAVVRGSERACVIVDMPFGSYQESAEQAYRNAARMMQETGCDGVKLEAGVAMASTIEFLAQRGIPVMGHIGLMPQSVNT